MRSRSAARIRRWASGLAVALALWLPATGQGAAAKGGVAVSQTSATELTLTYAFDPSALAIEAADGVARLALPGLERHVVPGEPVVPVRPAAILIPAGRRVTAVAFEARDVADVAGTHVVEHGQRAFPLSRPDLAVKTDASAAVYGSDALYPAANGAAGDAQAKHGYGVLPVRLFPVRYRPQSGRLQVARTLVVRVTLSADATLAAAGVQSRVARASDAAQVASLVDNPGTATTYAALPRTQGMTVSALPAKDVEHVIIAPQILLLGTGPGTFKGLCDHRNRRGMTSTNVSTEWIYGAYAGGDNPAKIRAFIRDAYQNWGTRFVLLGGAAQHVPPRMLFVDSGYGATTMPADLYYGCLDGSFDSNRNGVYGEPNDGADKGYGGSDVDLLAELAVGRASCESATDVQNLVRKIVAYEAATEPAYLSHVSHLSEHLGFSGVSEYGENCMEQIRLGGAYDGYFTTGFMNSEYADQFDTTVNLHDSPSRGDWPEFLLIDLMNRGRVHAFNHLGHANQTYCMKLNTVDLQQLQNTMPFFVYSQGCMPGWFDSDECFAEVITTMAAGAFSTVMNARYGWGAFNSTDGPSQRFHRKFWDVALGDDADDGEFHLGWMNHRSKERNLSYIGEGLMRWCTYELNLFGDPATEFKAKRTRGGIFPDRLAYQSTATVGLRVRDDNATGTVVNVSVMRYGAGFVSLANRGPVLASNRIELARSVSEYLGSFAIPATLLPRPVHDDTLVCTYVDEDIGDGTALAISTNVPIDDVAPAIVAGPLAQDVTDQGVTIVWQTDEPASGQAMVEAKSAPLPMDSAWWGVASVEGLQYFGTATPVSHVVSVTGLTSLTGHRYAIRSEDVAGNVRTVPVNLGSLNPADYTLGFATRYSRVVFFDELEAGQRRWTSGGLNDGWRLGTPEVGPSNAYSGANCWGVSLGADYEIMRHCWVESEPVYVRGRPVLKFKHWLQFPEPPPEPYLWWVKLPHAHVDVNYGHGWNEVTPWSLDPYDPYWDSEGWQEVSILLSNVTHTTVQVRFRVESRQDNYAPGWYVDDIELSELMDPGLWVKDMVLPLDDAPAYSGANDGDGYPDVGETVKVRFDVFNTDTQAHPSVTGIVEPGGSDTVLEGSGDVQYGNVGLGAEARGAPPVTLRIAAKPELAGARLPIFHTTRCTEGHVWTDTVYLYVDDFQSILGRVTNSLGQGVAGAEVVARASGYPSRTVTTDGSGNYTIAGIVRGIEYTMCARKPAEYLDSLERRATAPMSGVNFCLRRAFALMAPPSISVALLAGEQRRATLTVANTNGTRRADTALDFTLASTWYARGGVSIALSDGVAAPVRLAANARTNITVTIAASPSAVPDDYDATVSLIGTHLGARPQVPIHISVSSLAISGRVTTVTGGAPVTNAVVTATSAVGSDGMATTDTNGWYWLRSLASGVTYTLVAAKPGEFSPSDPRTATAPSRVDFTLGRAYAVPNPVRLAVKMGCYTNATVTLRLTNNDATNAPDINLKFDVENNLAVPGLSVGLKPRTNGVVRPRASTNMTITVRSVVPAVGTYGSAIKVVGNQVRGTTVPLSVQITNTAPWLTMVAMEMKDLGDGDGYLEPNENVGLRFLVQNTGTGPAYGTTGEVVRLSGPVTVTQPMARGLPGVFFPGGPTWSERTATFRVNAGARENDVMSFRLFLRARIDPSTNAIRWIAWSNDFQAIVGFSPDLVARPMSFDKTIYEGRMTNDMLTISNASVKTLDVKLRVEPVSAPLGGAVSGAAVAAARPPVNWATLNDRTTDMGTLLVRFRDDASEAAQLAAITGAGMKIKRRFLLINACSVEAPASGTLSAAAAALAGSPAVLSVEPNYRTKICTLPQRMPNDPAFGHLYGLHNTGQQGGTADADVDAPEAWARTVGETNVIVAVIDTGVAYRHEDLAANMWRNVGETGFDAWGQDRASNHMDDDGNGYVDDVYGYDFVFSWSPDGGPADDNGHGTHVAGTIAAVGNNGVGVAGVAWRARIMAIKSFDANGGGSTETELAGIEYAIRNGARIINASWGGYNFSPLLEEMIGRAAQSNVLILCAAGNDAYDADAFGHYPSCFANDNIVSVAAVDRDGLLAWFSNYGQRSVDLAAPGVDILSTYPGALPSGTYMELSGTSMATPHVAGVAALLASLSPRSSYRSIRQALFAGVVQDAALASLTSCGGFLNAYNSVVAFERFWLELGTNEVRLARGASARIPVRFNPAKNTLTGVYQASIGIEPALVGGVKAIPVRLTVLPAPRAVLASVRVDDSTTGDGDGCAEPGETVLLYVSLLNAGGSFLNPAVGTLSNLVAGVTWADRTCEWSAGIGNLATIESDGPARLTFGAGVSGDVNFTLRVSDGSSHGPWNLTFSLPVARVYSLRGTVRQKFDGSGVGGAALEYVGVAGGSATASADGAYAIHGLAPGAYSLQVCHTNYEKSPWMPLTVASADLTRDFALGSPVGSVDPSSVSVTVAVAAQTNVTLRYYNAGVSAWTGTLHEVNAPRAAVISDGRQLDGIEDLVRGLGLDCDVYSENAHFRYSGDPGVLGRYGLLIMDLTGASGTGRKIEEAEASLLNEFVRNGGRILFTGMNPLSSPDNQYLAQVAGSASVGAQEQAANNARVPNAAAGDPMIAGPCIALRTGAVVNVTSLRYDNAQPSVALGSVALLQAGAGAKVLHRRYGRGEAVLWTGNANGAEWRRAGALQDLLKNVLVGFIATDVSWLSLSASRVALAPRGSTSVTATLRGVNDTRDIVRNDAGVLLVNRQVGAPELPVSIRVVVWPRSLRLAASVGVVDWLNRPLQGNGNDNSCLLQMILAGPNGTNDPPNLDGSVSGDDRLATTLLDSIPYSRIGRGYEWVPDFGKFTDLFSMDTVAPGAKVYVRAWDARTFAEAVAYGDSPLYTVRNVVRESKDFLGWIVDRVPGYPGDGSLTGQRDYDGDTVPDGWMVKFGREARLPIEPLASDWIRLKELRIYHGSGHALFADPSRLARLGGWLFVADTDNNRVGICNTNLEDTVTYFTGGGTAAGLLSKPEGVAVDPVRKRLIVADTGNNRILILSANEATGALTYVSQVADPGDRSVFYAPAGVAVFPPSGYLYVADTGNHRIRVFTAAGEYLTAMYGTGFDNPKGVALDADGLVYVADTGHHRLVCMNGAGTTRWTVGGLGDANSKFNGLRDVNFGVKGRIYVADTGNNRIQVFEPQVFGAPTFVASYGPAVASQTSLQLPRAVLPATDDNTAFVADTVNNRVLRMRVIFDLDRDGMDDQWEDLVGLDPTNPNDARVDLDGDLIWNIGEYRLRTNPRLADTDGNGATDGWEVGNGFDPTATGMDLLLIRVFSGAQGNVGWNSVSGRVYRVEYATDLARGNWRLGTVVTSRTDGVVSWSHSVPPGERQRYYRIREVR